MTAYELLEQESRANAGWVSADTWFAAYETARVRRLGPASMGMARLLSKRPLEDNARDEEADVPVARGRRP